MVPRSIVLWHLEGRDGTAEPLELGTVLMDAVII